MTRLHLLLSALALAAFAAPSQATDAEFQQLHLARQPAALEALARERLARDALDETALWYWSRQAFGEPRQRAGLMPRVQACVRDRPQSARCQHALGLLIGAELMEAGTFTAMRRVGEVQERFERAVALAPADYAMRRDLQGLYLALPALMGGGARKARLQAEAVARIDAPRGLLLQAAHAIHDKQFDLAEQRLSAVQPAADRQLTADLQQVQLDLARALLDIGAAERGRQVIERQLLQDAGQAELHVELGRALLALKQPAAAVAALERALQLNPRLRLHHGLGAAHEAAGDTARAVAAYRLALNDPADKGAADQARQRLKALQP
ncbi:tetratricopeptide repeat protein [Roseateles sp. LYH14W]|uniref:Tetratricopeptide repeat protein n=1 Tax=Pelomonas parva TaxID=3299032 RepID=A0ABW7F159_9BURK